MPQKAIKLAGDRTKLIEVLNKKLESAVGKSQKKLLALIVSEFVDQLDVVNGKIQNTTRNQRLVSMLDNTFSSYIQTHSPAVLKAIVDGVTGVINFNQKYFSVFDKPAKLLPINKQVKKAVSAWLGIEDGKIQKNGYLDKLIQVDSVKQLVKDFAIGKVVNGSGYSETKSALQSLIDGDESGALGGLQKYYRNFTYDLFSKVDRTAAKITADQLDLKYAIYEGGLIKTSRKFCRDRNGKVFTSEEIVEFDPPEAKPPDYEPATDLGGYGCRHHLNYIPYAVAVAMRPDLKK